MPGETGQNNDQDGREAEGVTSEGLLYTELGALRKGWGLRRPSVRDRIGPELRKLCGIDETTTHSAARDRVTTLLVRAFGALPDEYARAARVMMAIEPDYIDQTLTQRQERLAGAWNVDPMTVRRRCNLALQLTSAHLAEHGGELVADQFDEEDSFRPNEWYTLTTSTTLRLDKPTPEATEVRKIVSLKEGLSRIALGLGLPRPRSESRPKMGLEVEMEFGGALESNRQPSAEYFVHYIRFPRPLAKGEEHTFGKIVRIPPGQLMAPHFVSRPLHRVDRFELRVKFDPARLPRVVWRISGIPYHVSEADGPGRDVIELDSLGEISVAFDRLKTSFAYGVRWLP
jgi:hypothetical protein